MHSKLVGLLAITLGAAVAPANPTRNDRDTIAALEEEWLKGEHDRDVLNRILAADFIHPVAAGVFLTKAQHIDWVVTHPGPGQQRRRFDNLRVRLYGDTAVITGIVAATNSDGREDRTVFTDIFVRRGRWEAVNAQENSVERRGR